MGGAGGQNWPLCKPAMFVLCGAIEAWLFSMPCTRIIVAAAQCLHRSLTPSCPTPPPPRSPQNNDLQMIVRAHECVMDGFERFAQGHLITLFR